MKNRFLQTLIALVIQLILLTLFGAAAFFALSSDAFFTVPLSIMIPLLLVFQLIHFFILFAIFRKDDN